jgi:hypothetical protein
LPDISQALEYMPRSLEFPLCRLIRVGTGSDSDYVARFKGFEFVTKRVFIPVFCVDFGFERLRISSLQKLVREPGIAVLAAILTTPVRINGPGERDAFGMATVEPSTRRQGPILDRSFGG